MARNLGFRYGSLFAVGSVFQVKAFFLARPGTPMVDEGTQTSFPSLETEAITRDMLATAAEEERKLKHMLSGLDAGPEMVGDIHWVPDANERVVLGACMDASALKQELSNRSALSEEFVKKNRFVPNGGGADASKQRVTVAYSLYERARAISGGLSASIKIIEGSTDFKVEGKAAANVLNIAAVSEYSRWQETLSLENLTLPDITVNPTAHCTHVVTDIIHGTRVIAEIRAKTDGDSWSASAKADLSPTQPWGVISKGAANFTANSDGSRSTVNQTVSVQTNGFRTNPNNLDVSARSSEELAASKEKFANIQDDAYQAADKSVKPGEDGFQLVPLKVVLTPLMHYLQGDKASITYKNSLLTLNEYTHRETRLELIANLNEIYRSLEDILGSQDNNRIAIELGDDVIACQTYIAEKKSSLMTRDALNDSLKRDVMLHTLKQGLRNVPNEACQKVSQKWYYGKGSIANTKAGAAWLKKFAPIEAYLRDEVGRGDYWWNEWFPITNPYRRNFTWMRQAQTMLSDFQLLQKACGNTNADEAMTKMEAYVKDVEDNKICASKPCRSDDPYGTGYTEKGGRRRQSHLDWDRQPADNTARVVLNWVRNELLTDLALMMETPRSPPLLSSPRPDFVIPHASKNF